MEPEVSLPQSQAPATCPYSEPARSSPHPHIPLNWPFVQNLLMSTEMYLGDTASKKLYLFVDGLKILYQILITLKQ